MLWTTIWTIITRVCVQSHLNPSRLKFNHKKCLPVLLYGTEVCPTNAADLHSMQFTINRVIIILFGTMSQNY